MAQALIEDPSIKIVDNGFIVCFREKTKDNSNTYDGYSTNYREEVFKDSESQKAMDRFMELGKASGKLKGAKSESEEEEYEE